MSTTTRTEVTHYHVQKKRRAQFLEDWRDNHRTVIRHEDVTLADTARGMRTGVYMGVDGDNPTRSMDALVHEMDPGTTTTVHRHSWDAMVFVVAGNGWTEIDGERVEWGPGDSLHLPAWAWHRSGNEGDDDDAVPVVLQRADAGHHGHVRPRGRRRTPTCPSCRAPRRTPTGPTGDDAYARRLRRLAGEQGRRRNGRLHTSWDSLELLNTPRGTRTTFLLDKAIGYQASGITMAMFEIGPGRGQSMHRHPGEAWLYVVEGEGHSYLGTEPEGGEDHPWKKGDLIVVDHYLWHQHFNDSATSTAKVVRIHMFDSLLETMRVLMDPVVLFEEPPEHIRDAQAGDPSTIQWPELTRPTWP